MAVQTQAADLRGLKALVAFLGVLIVLGTALVVSVVIKRIYAKPAAPSITGAMVTGSGSPAVPPAAAASLAPGERIAGIAGAGDEVAVWVSGPAGDRLLLVNPRDGAMQVVVSGATK